MKGDSYVTERRKWSQFWEKQRLWKSRDPFQATISLSRFLASPFRSRLACKYITKVRSRILEVGCGTAWSSILLARRKKSMQVVGVDFCVPTLVRAKRNSKIFHIDGTFILADANNLPFKNEAFDFVWSMGVLEHFEDPHSAVAEMVKVTRNGGVIVALIPSHNNLLVRVRDIIQKITGFYFDFHKAWGGSPAYRINLSRIFSKVGLTDIKAKTIPQELLVETMVVGWKR